MSASTVPAFIGALKTALELREGLAGVQIATAWMDAGSLRELLQIWQVPQDKHQWAAIGNRSIEESYSLEGGVWVVRAGAGDEIATAARARAYELLDEIESQLRTDPTVSGTVRVARLASASLSQYVADRGRAAQIDWTIEASARI